jgi:hypothetical protein
MKQTAVEWLVNEMPVMDWQDPYWKIKLDKAKAMEQEQMIDTFVEGMRCQNFDPNRGRGEQYYNATFNTNNK